MIGHILLILSFNFFSLLGHASEGASKLRTIIWEEVSKKEGITVYGPKYFDHSSGLVPIKFKATINSKIDKVLSVLADEKRKLEWLPKLKKIELLEKKSIQDFTVYYRYDAPWPFKDRDFVIKNLGTFDEEKYIVSVDLLSTKHESREPTTDAVRGSAIDGYSLIQKGNNGTTIVEMALLTDFGGMIPKFIVNIVQKSWPYNFMKHLRLQLKKNDIIILEDFKLDQDSKFLKK
jgi:hypothetical protein